MPVDDSRLESQGTDKKKFRTTFHRTFALSRDQIRQLLAAAAKVEKTVSANRSCLTSDIIHSETQLGTVQVEAMPRYARACGLLDERLCLTSLGRIVQDRDPLQETRTTQWLMHYYISSPHGLGPQFWTQAVTSLFRFGDEISHSQVARHIARTVAETEKRELSDRDARSTATIFLGAYTSPKALASLRILEELGDGRYLVQDPTPPSIWVFALALLDYWKTRYGLERRTINLDDLYVEGGLGDVFMMGGGRVNSHLHRLQEEGIVQIYSVAPPYQVVLLQRDAQFLLDRLYAHDDYP